MMEMAMEEEIEESRVDMGGVNNGWEGGKTTGEGGGVFVPDLEIAALKKGKESRESRKKRKEREAAGDLGEDPETKEDRKKRRDEKDKRRGKDLDENERRDHRGRKDSKRKKVKESKDKKERRDDRHVTGKEGKLEDDGKEVEFRDTSDKRERRERKLERNDSVDGGTHRREAKDRDRTRTGTMERSTVLNLSRAHGRKDDGSASVYVKSSVVDDDAEEGEILDEDSGPAKELESGETAVRGEVKRAEVGDDHSPTNSSVNLPDKDDYSNLESPTFRASMVAAGTVHGTHKSPPNALQGMLGIAEAYDSESQASDENPGYLVGGKSSAFSRSKEPENGRSRSGGPDMEGSLGTEKIKSVEKAASKRYSMGPPEQRDSAAKDRAFSRSGETRSRDDEPKSRSLQGMDFGIANQTDGSIEQSLTKRKHSRQSSSPPRDDATLYPGKRGNGGRRRRSPTPDALRDRQERRGRSRSKDSATHRHTERGRSRSLESGKEREVTRKRTSSPEISKDRSHVRSLAPSREGTRERRTGVDGHDRKKSSLSPDSSYERRVSRDNHENLDRGRRSKSRESGRLKPASRGDSVNRRRRSRSRESYRDKRANTDWETSRRAESMERRRRSRSRESSLRRGEDRENNRHGDGSERRRGSRSRDVPRDRKVDDRDSSRHEWRGDDAPYRNSRDDRKFRDGRHYESWDNVYNTDRDKDRSGMNSHDRSRGLGASQSKDNHHSTRDSLAENTREEENSEEYQERVASQLAAQEEDDIEKIIQVKEQSRRRRQAILEKYKRQEGKPAEEQSTSDLQGTSNTDAQDHPVEQSNGRNADPPAPIGIEATEADVEMPLGKGPLENGSMPVQTNPEGGLGGGSPKSERSADMFCDDIFGESPAGGRRLGKGDGLALDTSGLTDNWDDAEGYYCFRVGEILDGRYEVASSHGRGVFSTVVRARDLKAGRGEPEEVAIKIIRNNETMFKAGQQELVILKKLAGADPENKRHCVRLLSSFEYRSHLCLVFESLHMNLREILKKFGRNIGINLNAVRVYAKQLFIALKHLLNCGVLHCDIKPDNMLVNEAKNVLKLCDFGSAMFAGENEITPYLVSRFYRAPEIVLGLPYDHALDIWSVGCCLYELYTGKMLFPGHTNNDMLRLHMELKGPFPKKMLKKAAFADQHFDQDFNFCAIEEDPVTKKTIKRILVNIRPKEMGILVNSAGSKDEDTKLLASFKDLLEKIFILDPDKRLTVSQALSHPFISGK